MKKIITLFALTTLMGCTHLVSFSTTSIPKNTRKPISAETERFIFMAFNFDNNYVDDHVVELARQCPKGKVKGILTKHEHITHFPLFANTIRISSTGYCVKR